MKVKKSYFIVLLILLSTWLWASWCHPANGYEGHSLKKNSYLSDSTRVPKGYWATKFDFPVGPPNAAGYYNAQGFGVNSHLGDDWNGTGGGNSDLGDTIFAIASGFVHFARDIGLGWGNVIRVHHYMLDSSTCESIYAHCDTMLVKPKTWVHRGEPLGTIGNANGLYLAHLHLEIRDSIGMPIGGGYGPHTKGYVDPSAFIRARRQLKIQEE